MDEEHLPTLIVSLRLSGLYLVLFSCIHKQPRCLPILKPRRRRLAPTFDRRKTCPPSRRRPICRTPPWSLQTSAPSSPWRLRWKSTRIFMTSAPALSKYSRCHRYLLSDRLYVVLLDTLMVPQKSTSLPTRVLSITYMPSKSASSLATPSIISSRLIILRFIGEADIDVLPQ